MKNKGFSLIELLVAIAIIIVLVGVLAPMLVKYISKSKLSADIANGRELATAIMTVVTNDTAKDNAVEHATPQPVADMDGNDFKKAVYETLGVDEIKGKSRKDTDGNEFDNPVFYYTLDAAKNKVEIYYGGITDDYQIYPVTGTKLVK